MFVTTTERLPDGVTLAAIFSAIEVTSTVKIKRSMIGDIFRKSEAAEHQAAHDRLLAAAERYQTDNGVAANAVIGARLSTTTAELEDGVYLFLTWYGTPAVTLIEDQAVSS